MLLQSIRDRATGWIAWVIVILISIPFALWGIQEYLSPASNVAVAIVNGNEVGINEFQRTYQRQRSQLQALLGQSFDINQIDEDRLREESLNQLINDEVVLQAAIAPTLSRARSNSRATGSSPRSSTRVGCDSRAIRPAASRTISSAQCLPSSSSPALRPRR
jgi:hypothetical protein